QGGRSLWKNGRCAASPSPHHAIARFSRAFIRMLLPFGCGERSQRAHNDIEQTARRGRRQHSGRFSIGSAPLTSI
ncbi:hypothetical protein QUH12_29705, partial [Klebsiella pneumoniae]|nr:hypothetical protein [Klebsiella pneumoniae]